MLKLSLKKLIGFTVISMVIGACTSETQQSTFVLSGTIENPDSDVLYLEFENRTDTIPMDSGYFNAAIPLDEVAYFTLKHGNGYFPLVGAPEESLSVSFNYKLLDAMPEMTGTLVAENEYLNKKEIFQGEKNAHMRELLGSSLEDFLESAKEIEGEKSAMVADLKENGKSQFSSDVLAMENKKNTIEHQRLMLQFQLYYPYYHEGVFTSNPEFVALRGEVDCNDPELLSYWAYVPTILMYLEAQMGLEKDQMPTLEQQIEAIENTVQNQLVKENLLVDVYRDELEYKDVDKAFDGATTFAKSITDSTLKANFSEILTVWESLRKGNPAPIIEGVDKDGNAFSTADLIGKVVYVDFWATWCGPCRREIPFLDKMIEENEREDLVFLSISVDQDKGDWDKWMVEKETHGLQWHGNNSVLRKAYNINGIPRYAIINKDGTIYKANAARPSGKAKEVLAELLKQEV